MEELQSRHRKEKKDLQAKITQKKKSASKKTRKGVNEECDRLEQELVARHAQELAALTGDTPHDDAADEALEKDAVQDQEAPKESGTPEDALAEDVAKLSVSADSSQQPKKQNRAKARLARRAAEQARIVEEAEAEAQNIPDMRTQEKERLGTIIKQRGLQEKEVRADGHCLYAAMADQIRQQGEQIKVGSVIDLPDDYRTVRYVAADYIASNPDDFVPFLEEDLDSYLRKIRDTGEWGGQIELMALAKAYRVQIQVVHGDGNVIPIGDDSNKKVWLAYYRHGFGLGEHYNSLRKASETAT